MKILPNVHHLLDMVLWLLLCGSFLLGEATQDGSPIQKSYNSPLGSGGWTVDQLHQLCNDLASKQSLVRCKWPGEDLAKPGKEFLEERTFLFQKPLNLTPVVFLPGFAGSGLEAKLQKKDTPAWYCYEKTDWFRIWLALEEVFVQDCWMDNLILHYNPENNTYNNAEGVDIRGIDFGGIEGVAYLDYIYGIPIPFTSVYSTIIESLKAVGYTPGTNLRGAPYDWRFPPDYHLAGLYPQLKELIEDTYSKNGNTQVNIVTHSMGGPTFTYFLNEMPKEWKQKYIRSFIPIAGPWAGSPKALRAIISGDNLGIEFLGLSVVNRLQFRKLGRSSGGLISLLPDPFFWGNNQILVRTTNRNYTSWDIADLLKDLGATTSAAIYKNVKSLFPSMKAPEVHTHCLYGTNKPTEIEYTYPNSNWDEDPTEINTSDQGDGTVPLKSLQQCQTWSTQQSETIEIKEFDESDHLSVLQDQNVVKYVLDVITNG